MTQPESKCQIFFETGLLKTVISEARREFLQNYRESGPTDISLFFAAEEDFDAKLDQPINEVEIASESPQVFNRIELYPLQTQLVEIQHELEANLRTVIGGARQGVKPSDVSVLAETPEYYILYDKLEIIRESLEAEHELPYTVLSAHRLKATKILDRVDVEVPSGNAPMWVIEKPSNWYDGQWAMMQTLGHFLQCGMSPTEALDYWMVTVMNAPVQYWADIRNKSKDTVYNQVRKAKKKINPEEHPDAPTEYDYSGRTYGNNYVENGEYMTVDNGLLHSRRDIMNPSLSGKMTSGYGGAGPKQLAVAILGDLYGREQAEQLAQELQGEIQHLAIEDEDGQWTLSEQELHRWYCNP